MDKAEKFWDKQSVRFEKQISRDEEEFHNVFEKIEKYLDKSDTLLDYACGIGTSSLNMAGHVKESQAIYISSGMIEIAKKRLSEKPNIQVEFIHTTIFNNQFKPESYNCITAFNIMHLLDNTSKVIQHIYHLLKPGGLFISTTAFLADTAMHRFIFSIIKFLGVVPHLRLLKINEFKSLLASEKFQVLESHKMSDTASNHLIIAKKLNS